VKLGEVTVADWSKTLSRRHIAVVGEEFAVSQDGMEFAHAAFNILDINHLRADWALGRPLNVPTVVVHVVGLALIRQRVHVVSELIWRPHTKATFVVLTGAATLVMRLLLRDRGNQVVCRLMASRRLPDFRSAVLYSRNAMTSYPHTNLSLEGHWRFTGAL